MHATTSPRSSVLYQHAHSHIIFTLVGVIDRTIFDAAEPLLKRSLLLNVSELEEVELRKMLPPFDYIEHINAWYVIAYCHRDETPFLHIQRFCKHYARRDLAPY